MAEKMKPDRVKTLSIISCYLELELILRIHILNFVIIPFMLKFKIVKIVNIQSNSPNHCILLLSLSIEWSPASAMMGILWFYSFTMSYLMKFELANLKLNNIDFRFTFSMLESTRAL